MLGLKWGKPWKFFLDTAARMILVIIVHQTYAVCGGRLYRIIYILLPGRCVSGMLSYFVSILMIGLFVLSGVCALNRATKFFHFFHGLDLLMYY